MADLRLDRTDRAPGLFGFAEHFLERRNLNGVTDLGAGAVGFNQLDGAWVHIALRVSPPQRLLLTGSARLVNRRATAVTRSTDSLDHGIDLVAIALGIGQALDDDDSQAFAEGRAVTIGIEGSRVSGRRQRRRLAEAGVHEDIVEGVDTTGHNHVGVSGREFQGGQVKGAQRAAAGGIDDTVGAAKIKMLADPSGHHVAEQTGKGVLLPGHVGIADALHDVFGNRIGDAGVLERFAPAGMTETGTEGHDQLQRAGDTENHADPVAIEFLVRGVTCILQGLFDSDQAKQLRRIDRLQGVGQHTVLHRVEIHRRKEAAVLGVYLVGRFRVRVKIIIGTPVAFGDLGDCINTLPDIAPEGSRVPGPGEKTAYADNRQRRHGLRLPVLIEVVVLQLRNSLICSISRGVVSSASSSRLTPCSLSWLARISTAAPKRIFIATVATRR